MARVFLEVSEMASSHLTLQGVTLHSINHNSIGLLMLFKIANIKLRQEFIFIKGEGAKCLAGVTPIGFYDENNSALSQWIWTPTARYFGALCVIFRLTSASWILIVIE